MDKQSEKILDFIGLGIEIYEGMFSANNNIKDVIFNKKATIVFWYDGTKTVVKTSPHDRFDKEKGILWAYFLKHAYGSKTKLQKEIRKFVEKEEI